MKPIESTASQLSFTLKSVGYRRFRLTFNRERESGLVHVVNLQGSRWGDEFTVNLGVHVAELWRLELASMEEVGRRIRATSPGLDRDAHDPQPRPRRNWIAEYDCQLRMRLTELVPPHQDRWWQYDDLARAIGEIRELLETAALPYLDKYATRRDIADRWRSKVTDSFPADWAGSARQAPLILKAKLLKDLGQAAEAEALISECIDESRGRPWHESTLWLAGQIRAS